MKNIAGDNPARLYLDILKKSLLNEIFLNIEVAYFYARDCAEKGLMPELSTVLDIEANLAERYSQTAVARNEGKHLERDLRNIGFSHTMIGRARLDQLDECIHSVISNKVPGDFIECGVWRGGATIFMRGAWQFTAYRIAKYGWLIRLKVYPSRLSNKI